MNAPPMLLKLTQTEWPSTSEAEQRLLDFFGSLVLDLARTHSRVTQQQVALWVARVAVGAKK